MKFGFIHAKKACYPVAVLCEQLGVSRSGYYAWTKRCESPRSQSDRALSLEVAAVHQESRGQASTALFEYIEVFYNRKRRHSSLGYLSPVEYERSVLPTELAA